MTVWSRWCSRAGTHRILPKHLTGQGGELIGSLLAIEEKSSRPVSCAVKNPSTLRFINGINSWLGPERTGLVLNVTQPCCDSNLSTRGLNNPAGAQKWEEKKKYPWENCLISERSQGGLLRTNKKEQPIGICAYRQRTICIKNIIAQKKIKNK